MTTYAVKRDAGWKEAVKRIQNLPKAYKDEIRAGTRAHVEGVKQVLAAGLRKNNLVQPKLSSSSIAIRRALKRPFHESVFVGEKGDMINSMQVFELQRGFGLQPVGYAQKNIPSVKPTRILWSTIWAIQENGAVITVTQKMRGFFAAVFGINLKASTTTIRIPARHPLRKAVNRYLRSAAKEKVNKSVVDQIKKWIVK